MNSTRLWQKWCGNKQARQTKRKKANFDRPKRISWICFSLHIIYGFAMFGYFFFNIILLPFFFRIPLIWNRMEEYTRRSCCFFLLFDVCKMKLVNRLVMLVPLWLSTAESKPTKKKWFVLCTTRTQSRHTYTQTIDSLWI